MLKRLMLAVFMVLACAVVAQAADAPQSGEIKNDWFSLTLPAGWEELKVPNQPAMPGVNLMLVNKEKNCFASIAVAPGMNSAKAAADNAVAAMRKQKVKIDDPVEVDGIYQLPVTRGAAKGTAYFGSNGKDGGIVTVFGDGGGAIKELFSKFVPVDPAMFPKL